MWQQWINGILGLWVVLLPFLNLSTDGTFTYTMVVTGIIVAVLAFWGAGQYQSHHQNRGSTDRYRS